MRLTSTAIAIVSVTFAAIFISHADAGSYVISDDRVRDLDASPSLGRGYSIMTNSFQSTCMNSEVLTIPSFNYDYSFYDFVGSDNVAVDMSSKLSFSFALEKLRSTYEGNLEAEPDNGKTVYYTAASMRIERYYSSIREELSTLNDAALTLLAAQDYVGFFKACGPNYVRGIRRAQEVTTLFSLKSSNQETAASYSSALQTSGWSTGSGDNTNDYAYTDISKELTIKIYGYGLGLTEDGSETLLATKFDEFKDVMKFAWKTMTSNPNAAHIGMVYGIEVMPWVNNLAFQIATDLSNEVIEIPTARSLIPVAYLIDETQSAVAFSEDTRNLFKCKHYTHAIDKYGYCCEEGALYDPVEKIYNPENLFERVCRPVRQLERALVAENLIGNGEFIARLDRGLRLKLLNMSALQKCMAAVKSIPSRYDFNLLKKMPNSYSVAAAPTVFEMKMALDPFGDFALVDMVGKEVDEYLDRFYTPCLAAIYGIHSDFSAGTDVKYIMAYPWHHHAECRYLSCFVNGMRWDRDGNKGCVPGIMTGEPSDYVTGSTAIPKCKKAIDSFGDSEACEHDNESLQRVQSKLKTCSSNVSRTVGSASFFFDNFCLPEVTTERVTIEDEALLRRNVDKYCSCGVSTQRSMNVALGKKTTQTLTAENGVSSRAVDGKTDGYWFRNSVTKTISENQPFWSVDLGESETISKIVVWTRTDCCHEELAGATIKCYLDGVEQIWMETITSPQKGMNEFDNISSGEDVICDKIEIQLPGTGVLSLAEVQVFNTYTGVDPCASSTTMVPSSEPSSQPSAQIIA